MNVDNRSLKLILIGSSSVGKTSFCNRICGKYYDDKQLSTIGVDFHIINLTVKGIQYTLQLWDTAGHERYNSITSTYYRGSDIVILCFDLTKRESLTDLILWVNDVNNTSDDVVFFLLGMKSDLESEINEEEITNFMNDHKILSYRSISSKTNDTNFTSLLKNFVEKYILETDERKFTNLNTSNYITDVAPVVTNTYDMHKCCYFS